MFLCNINAMHIAQLNYAFAEVVQLAARIEQTSHCPKIESLATAHFFLFCKNRIRKKVSAGNHYDCLRYMTGEKGINLLRGCTLIKSK